ncbi:MAG: formate dehydrogenase subunit gamma [Hyphomicrobiaceae bacterium]
MTHTVIIRPAKGQKRGPEPIKQPDSELAISVKGICAAHGNKPDELLEILHAVQHTHGFVAEDALPVIANALNLSRAEVHGVVTFYHDFRREPAGHHVVKICHAEACQAMGTDKLCDHAESKLGTQMGSTSPDGRYTLEAAYCLGNCALAPAVMIDGDLKGRVDSARFDDLIVKASKGKLV